MTIFYFIHYNGERKQEGIKNLKAFSECGFMNILIRNVWNKQQQRVFWDFIDWCIDKASSALLSIVVMLHIFMWNLLRDMLYVLRIITACI